MIKECPQFNTSIKDFKAMSPVRLELFCRDLVRDVHFRFATFQKMTTAAGTLHVFYTTTCRTAYFLR